VSLIGLTSEFFIFCKKINFHVSFPSITKVHKNTLIVMIAVIHYSRKKITKLPLTWTKTTESKTLIKDMIINEM